jgi:hypothetical protein
MRAFAQRHIRQAGFRVVMKGSGNRALLRYHLKSNFTEIVFLKENYPPTSKFNRKVNEIKMITCPLSSDDVTI